MGRTLLTIVTISKDDPAGLAATLASTAQLRSNTSVEQVIVEGGQDLSVLAAEVTGCIRLAQNTRGIAAAFNEGWTAGRGEWMWFLNGGDRLDERMNVGILLEILDTARADVIVCGTTYDGDSHPKPFLPPKMRWPSVISWIPHPSTFIRRAMFERFGPYDESFRIAMDYEWWLRALSSDARVDVVSLPVARFSTDGVSMHPDQQHHVRREVRRAIWMHRGTIVRAWLGQTRRTVRELVAAGRNAISGAGSD